MVSLLIERLGNGFRPYLNTTLPPALDRLGDTRETVREKAHYLITKLMEEEVVEPQPLFEKMQSAFTHKNGKVREEILILMQNTLNVWVVTTLRTITYFHVYEVNFPFFRENTWWRIILMMCMAEKRAEGYSMSFSSDWRRKRVLCANATINLCAGAKGVFWMIFNFKILISEPCNVKWGSGGAN